MLTFVKLTGPALTVNVRLRISPTARVLDCGEIESDIDGGSRLVVL